MNEVTDAEFAEKVLDFKGAVLIDIWAPWCAPCRALGPILEGLENDVQDVVFLKLNADENPIIMAGFNVRAIPTVLLFRDGKLLDRSVGPNKGAVQTLLALLETLDDS